MKGIRWVKEGGDYDANKCVIKEEKEVEKLRESHPRRLQKCRQTMHRIFRHPTLNHMDTN